MFFSLLLLSSAVADGSCNCSTALQKERWDVGDGSISGKLHSTSTAACCALCGYVSHPMQTISFPLFCFFLPQLHHLCLCHVGAYAASTVVAVRASVFSQADGLNKHLSSFLFLATVLDLLSLSLSLSLPHSPSLSSPAGKMMFAWRGSFRLQQTHAG